MTAHACDGELVRTIYYAPIGVPGEHTAFVLFRCPCGRAGVFPEVNYRATTAEFRREFESGLAVQGARIELVGAQGAPITTDSAARLQAEAGSAPTRRPSGIIVVELDEQGNRRPRELDRGQVQRIIAPTGRLDADGFYLRRRLRDGRWAGVMPLMYQWARLAISASQNVRIEQAFAKGFAYVRDYPNRELAISTLLDWGGEGNPPGSHGPSADNRQKWEMTH
jgi:hypothetical protein